MKKIATFLPLFLLSLSGYSQTHFCGVPHHTHEKELQRLTQLNTLKNSATAIQLADGDITYVPIKIHLLGRDDNTGYADLDALNDALAELNKKFQPINVEFYFSGSDFNYYANSQFYNGNQTEQQGLTFHNNNGHGNAVNLYIARTVRANNIVVGGWAFLEPQIQQFNRMWVYTQGLNDNKTLIHEMGHYFGLEHTFNNSEHENSFERELVTRNNSGPSPRLSANCDVTGDFICDTPSDPFGRPNTNVIDCNYVGTAADLNNDQFDPIVDNIMGYNFCDTNTLTQGQYDRMTEGTLIVTNGWNFTLDAPETQQQAPGNVTVTESTTGITISWTDNSAVETGYIIEEAANLDGPYTPIGGVRANITSFNHNQENTVTGNYYRVKASNTKNIYSPTAILGTTGLVVQSPALYPNPVSDVLNINMPAGTAVSSVSISDVSGKTVLQSLGNLGSINLTGLAGGMYIVTVKAGDKNFVHKVIKE